MKIDNFHKIKRAPLDDQERNTRFALEDGDNSFFLEQCSDGNFDRFAPTVMELTEYLIRYGQPENHFENYVQSVEGLPILEQALTDAISNAIPHFLRTGAFSRIDAILNLCAGNPKLEAAFGARHFLTIQKEWLATNDFDSLARLKRLKYHKFLDAKIFDFGPAMDLHFFPIGASKKGDLIITIRNFTQVACHIGEFIGTPTELVQHWKAVDQRNEEEKIEFDKQKKGTPKNRTSNFLPRAAENKTTFLISALLKLKNEDPRLTQAVDQNIHTMDQLVL